MVDPQLHTFYFPAYELVIDDLRDYRFYAEDMVHPNYAATNYVWEKFLEACVHEDAKPLMKEIAAIHSAYRHKPFQPQSEQHRHFLQVHALKTRQLMQNHPYLNLGEELAFFTTGIQ